MSHLHPSIANAAPGLGTYADALTDALAAVCGMTQAEAAGLVTGAVTGAVLAVNDPPPVPVPVPTQADVAALAGVNPATVSRYLNTGAGSPATAAAIDAAVTQLGYERHPGNRVVRAA